MNGELPEIYEDANVISEEFQAEIDEEIASQPADSAELLERLDLNHETSPAESGGDIDARWEDTDSTGEESVGGSQPTPDQSDVEANAHAMGIDFQDNEPLDFIEKMEKRDRDRFELDEDSKEEGDMI
ncbi:MAG TPA: DUF6335 family protein [Pyrinomonadaceae bacterium]|jgi:hypothetical protein|nr:DUF6335 family protein [Pyrinomonadaceae bacterium]